MTYVNFTEFRKNMASHLDRMEKDATELVVTRQNREPFIVVSLREWEGMRETAYLLSNPANAAQLLQSIADADAGLLTEHELIEP